MPKLGLSGGRPRTRHENGVLLAYAVTPAKKYYVSLLKKRQEVKFFSPCLNPPKNIATFLHDEPIIYMGDGGITTPLKDEDKNCKNSL